MKLHNYSPMMLAHIDETIGSARAERIADRIIARAERREMVREAWTAHRERLRIVDLVTIGVRA